MPEPEGDIERIIEAAIWGRSKGDPAALARAILEDLWDAGYDVTHRPDVVPTRSNPDQE